MSAWTTPADLVAQLDKLWARGRLLDGTCAFPLALRLRAPGPAELADRFDDVRRWIRSLEEGSRSARGFGYDLAWREVNHRQLGRNRVPESAAVPTADDALRLLGRVRDARRFRALSEATLASFPSLASWLPSRPLRALEHADEWDRVLAVLAWFRDHPRSGLYLRQLDVPGVDTKFVESRRGLLAELLDRVLPPEAIDQGVSGAAAFERRYGLRAKPALVRFRVLDPRLRVGGLSDLTVPVAELARLDVRATRVLVTENEVNGLALPDLPGALVIFGLGYALEALADLPWLRDRALHYWGDLDTHGFAILDRLRAALPHARSFLMDRDTLLAHRALWVTERTPHDGALTRLTPEERALYDDLRADRLGERVRLEQERVAFGHVERALAALAR